MSGLNFKLGFRIGSPATMRRGDALIPVPRIDRSGVSLPEDTAVGATGIIYSLANLPDDWGDTTWSTIGAPDVFDVVAAGPAETAELELLDALDYDAGQTIVSHAVRATPSGPHDPIDATFDYAVTNVLEVVLADRSLSDTTGLVGAAPGTKLADIVGVASGSSVSIVPPNPKLVVVGTELRAGLTAAGVETINFTLRETNPDAVDHETALAFTFQAAASPSAIADDDWTLVPGEAPGTLELGVTDVELNGGTLDHFDYRLEEDDGQIHDAGSSLPLDTVIMGLTPGGPAVDVEVRPVSVEGGPGPWSNIRSEVPTGDEPPVYTEQGTIFDGTNDFLLRDTGLTGVVAGRRALVFMSVEFNDGETVAFEVILGCTFGGITIQRFGAGTSVRCEVGSVSMFVGVGVLAERMDMLFAIDADGTSWSYVKKGGAAWVGDTDASGGGADFDFTGQVSIGAQFNGNEKANITHYRTAIWHNITLPDITDSAVRDLFIDPGTGELADPALSVAALGAPSVDIYGDAAVLNAGTNNGSGGSFAMTGAVVDA